MQIAYSYTGLATLSVTETILSSSTFMWQTKVRFILAPFSGANPSTSFFAQAGFILKNIPTTGTTKAIGVYLLAQITTGASGPQGYYPLSLVVNSGANLTSNRGYQLLALTGIDIRLRIGIQGSNLVVQISNDAYNWLTAYSETFQSGPSLNGSTPNTLVLETDNLGSYSPVNAAQLAAWDYVRMMA
jgi:hypothetical protein